MRPPAHPPTQSLRPRADTAGTSPTYAGTHTQNSRGIYVGLEGDVVKQLSMGLAGRYEHYSSLQPTVGKFNAIWHASDAIALRATVGSGFHALRRVKTILRS